MIQRSHSTAQHIIERYKKENRTTSKVKKSTKKIFIAYDEHIYVKML